MEVKQDVDSKIYRITGDKERVKDFLMGVKVRLESLLKEDTEQLPWDTEYLHLLHGVLKWVNVEATYLCLKEIRDLSHELSNLSYVLISQVGKGRGVALEVLKNGTQLLKNLFESLDVALKEDGSIHSDRRVALTIDQVRRILVQEFLPSSEKETGVKTFTLYPNPDSLLQIEVGQLEKFRFKLEKLRELNSSAMDLAEKPALNGVILREHLAHVDLILNDLQRGLAQARKVRLSHLFQVLHGLVQQIGTQLGKEVRLNTVGDDYEVDRYIVERMKEPLVHLIHNAIYHGIEDVEARVAKGKQAQGTLTLKVVEREDCLVWEFSDDGGGVDRWAVMAKALEKAIIAYPSKASDKEVHHWMFELGVSTAPEHEKRSDKGIGLDSVKRSIEDLDGKIDVRSMDGRGCSFVMSIPMKFS